MQSLLNTLSSPIRRGSLGCAALALSLLGLASVSQAQAPLTLDDAIQQALQENFDIKISRIAAETADGQLDIAEADYDPTLTASARTGITQRAGATSTLDGVTQTGPRSDTTVLRVGASQKITTGATITVSSDVNRAKTNSSNSLLNPAYDGDLSLSFTQPLLKNAGTTVNKAAIVRAKLGVERADHDLRGAVLDVVRDVETAYFNLVFAREQLGVNEFSLGVAEKLFDENKSRRETGVATDLDVLQAEVGVANARRNVVLATQTVSDREDALLNLLGNYNGTREIGPVALPNRPVPAVDFAKSYGLARQNRPDLASGDAALKQLEVDMKAAKRNRLPQLDLGGAVGYNTLDDNYGDAVKDLVGAEGYSWQVNLSLTMPWGNEDAKARLRNAKLAVNRQETRQEQLSQTILVQVRNAIRSVQANVEALDISGQSVRLSEKQYELEKARYDAGLSTFRRVQESQADLDTARVNYVRAQVNLQTAEAELARLEGSTAFDRYNITLAR